MESLSFPISRTTRDGRMDRHRRHAKEGALGSDGGCGDSFFLPRARGFPSLAFAKIAEVRREDFASVAERRRNLHNFVLDYLTGQSLVRG